MTFDLSKTLQDLWNYQYTKDEIWERIYSNCPQFRYQGLGYRAVIADHATFDPDYNLKKYLSWSSSREGAIEFLKNTFLQNLEMNGNETVFIMEGDVDGIDISKMISSLKEEEKSHLYNSVGHSKEQELIAISASQRKVDCFLLKNLFDVKNVFNES